MRRAKSKPLPITQESSTSALTSTSEWRVLRMCLDSEPNRQNTLGPSISLWSAKPGSSKSIMLHSSRGSQALISKQHSKRVYCVLYILEFYNFNSKIFLTLDSFCVLTKQISKV